MTDPLTRIAVFGGGLVALSAATALARALPDAAVMLILTPDDAAALADRVPGTLPALAAFNAAIGFPDSDMIGGTGAMPRLATRFEHWSADGGTWWFGYGAIGDANLGHHWLAARADGDRTPLSDYHAGAMLAAAGHVTSPEAAPALTSALTIDPAGYGAGLTALARHRGVAVSSAAVEAIERDARGITAVMLSDGRRIVADLFIDATGPAATLLSALDPAFESWSGLLPADRMLLGDTAPEPVLHDTVVALDQGWCWRVPGRRRTMLALVYAAAATADDEVARLFAATTGQPPTACIAYRPGRQRRSWIGNVVAVGDAAVTIDPLHATNLQLAHGAILRLRHLLPDRRFAPALVDTFNRRTAAEADRVRDFVAMHYRRPGRRDGAFWRIAASAPAPDSLTETLDLLDARGRMPHFEEETFTPVEWQMAAFGLGLIPSRIDAMALAMPEPARRALLRAARERTAALVHAAHAYRLPPAR